MKVGGKTARRLLRHHDLRHHARDRRRERQDPLAVHAARLLGLGRLGADHDDDAGRRPGRAAIYAGAPDGRIRKLSVATGKELWSTSITRDPTHEKLAAPLNFANGLVIAATGGYIGDAPPYQGHVVTLSPANGKIVGGLELALLRPPRGDPALDLRRRATRRSGGAPAPVVDPATGDLLVATGNAPFDGKTNWGDSVLVLSPDAKRPAEALDAVEPGSS